MVAPTSMGMKKAGYPLLFFALKASAHLRVDHHAQPGWGTRTLGAHLVNQFVFLVPRHV
jgi:hypothetical protein